MLRGLKDYARCSIKNRFVAGSYTAISLGLLIKYFEHQTGIQNPIADEIALNMLVGGGGLLGATLFGLDTYLNYVRVKTHIKNNGSLDPRIGNRLKGSRYCTRVGARMAAEEAGLENFV